MSYDFKTWKEVDYWLNCIHSELKDVANVWDHIANWEYVSDAIDMNTTGLDVAEEFSFDDEQWVEEVLEQIKPHFEKWLEKLLVNPDIDYSDYVADFWISNYI